MKSNCRSQKKCAACGNAGWLTREQVAACNCCEHGEFWTPIKKKKVKKVSE